MTDHLEIKKSLLKIYPFSEGNLNLFLNKLVFRTLKKKDVFLRKNQICKEIAFVNSGSLRLYTEIEHREWTINFFTENCWVSDIESLLMQQPSKNQIEALENSNIALITLKDIHRLMDIHPGFRMLNALMANFIISSTHITAMIAKSPDERYKDLLSNHPDWVNRFPQMKIASYLGITPESLSRVRARVI